MERVILIPHAIASLVRAAAEARGCTSLLLELGPGSEIPAGGEQAAGLFRYRIPRERLAAMLPGLPALTWMHTASSGVDQFYFPGISARGIVLTTSRGAHSDPIAEHALALLLALAKNLAAHHRAQRERRWHHVEGEDLAGKTIGIIGLGSVGRAIAARARALGMRVIGIRRTGQPVPEAEQVWDPSGLDALLAGSDAVVVAAPVTAQTRSLINEAALRTMRPTAWLLNVARGELVDEDALIRALREGWIAGAALDTFRHEPLPSSSPLYDCPRLIVTSHCSALTPALDRHMAEMFAENLRRFERGDPLMSVYTPGAEY